MIELKQQIMNLVKETLIDETRIIDCEKVPPSSSRLRVEQAYHVIPEIRQLILDYQETISSHLCFEDIKDELEQLPSFYHLPEGCLYAGFVEAENRNEAENDDKVAGCVALKPIDRDTCELKRFYVKPEFRGLSLGLMLLKTAIAYAKKQNYNEIVLSTLPTMEKAVSLYKSCGFVEIDTPRPADEHAHLAVDTPRLAHDCESKCYHLNLKG